MLYFSLKEPARAARATAIEAEPFAFFVAKNVVIIGDRARS